MVENVDKDLLRQANIDLDEVDKEVEAIMQQHGSVGITQDIESSVKNFEVGSILKGRVLNVSGGDVIVDVGYKSEGKAQQPRAIKVEG